MKKESFARSRYHIPAALMVAVAAFSLEQASAEDYSRSPGHTVTGNYLAAQFAYSHADFNEADGYLGKALQVSPEDLALLQRSFRSKLVIGDLPGAYGLAEQMATQESADDRDRMLSKMVLAVRDIEATHYESAYDYLSAIETTGTQEALVRVLMAWAKAGMGGPAEGVALLDAAETNTVGADARSMLLLHKALLLDMAREKEKAKAAYEQAIATAREAHFRYYQLMGNFYERQGSQGEADALYAAFEQARMEDILLDDFRERVMDKDGKPKAAVTNVQQGAAEAFLTMAELTGNQSMASEIYTYLNAASHLHPKLSLVQVKLASLLESDGRYEEAIATYEKVAKNSVLYTQSKIWKALVYERMGKQAKAIKLLKELAQGSKAPELMLNLGNVQRRASHFAEAADSYTRAIAKFPEEKPYHWLVYYYRAVCYERSKQWELAEKDFHKALELEPDQPDVLNYLGYSWLELGMHMAQAREILQKAVAARPNDAHIIDSYGWALYKHGEYDAAATYLERAIEIMPHDATLNDHLGDVYWRAGRKDEAEFQWRRALTFEPAMDLVARIETKLRNGMPPAMLTETVEKLP